MGWLISALASAFGGAILNIVGSLVGRLLVSLGIGVASYTGLTATMTWLKSGVSTAASGLNANVLGILSLMQVGSCISMVFSAMMIRFTLQGMQSDTIKSWVKK